MKKLIFLSFLIIAASCGSKKSGDFTVSGVISNLFSEEVTVFYPKNAISKDMEEVSAKLDENKAFTITLNLPEAKIGFIRIGTTQFPLYLIPGGNINLTYDALLPDSLPVVTGKKSSETTFIFDFMKHSQEKYGREWLFETFAKNYDEFIPVIEEAYKEKLSFLKGFKGTNKLDKSFRKMMEADFLFDKKLSLLNYPEYYGFLSQGAKPNIPDDFMSFVDDKKLFNDKYLTSQYYIAFVNTVLEKKVGEKVNASQEEFNADSYLSAQFQLANEMFTGKTRELAVAGLMENIFGYASKELAIEKYEEFKSLVKNQEYLDHVEAMYRASIALSVGQPAPNFTLTDINGNKVSLSDFAGKVVYLDFWASWCGPCLQQIPSARELKKRMEGKDVVFLYVSLDEDQEAWKKKVAEEKLEGVHLNAPGLQQEVAKLYNVRGVPTFFIIGKDGLIFDNRPPRPSDENIDSVLLAALVEE